MEKQLKPLMYEENPSIFQAEIDVYVNHEIFLIKLIQTIFLLS